MSVVSGVGAMVSRTMRPRRDDGGFTLVEVVVSIGLINVLMAALTVFYAGTGSINHHQGLLQDATRMAASAMERARALGGSAMLEDRDEASVRGQDRVQGVDPYLQGAELAWDADAAASAGASAPLPTNAVRVTLAGVDFWQHWYVVACWQAGSATDCTAANKTAPLAAPFMRVVVAVTWRDKECAGWTCAFITSTSFSTGSDPVFGVPKTLVKPDVYFLADTTGSMEGALANVRANAAEILAEVDAVATDPRYGAGQYRDFSDPWAYQNDASIPVTDDSGAAAQAGINTWATTPGAGGDIPEASLFALHRLVTSANFRPGSMPIVVWFGDAPGHDPVCAAVSGASDVTEASVTAELRAANVTVIAVSTTTGAPEGLDGDPAAEGGGYSECGATGGTAGQATRIAAATGGKFFRDVPPRDVSDAIIAGITTLR